MKTPAAAFAILSLVTITLSAQDIAYKSGVFMNGQQGGINVIALDPVDVGGVVTGAPYTADAVTEVTQQLPDGNRIEQRTSASIARNSEGATRREQQGIALGTFVAQHEQSVVTITDPANGTHLTLNYDLKVAFRMKPQIARLEMKEGMKAKIELAGGGQWEMAAGQSASGTGAVMIAAPPPPPPPPPGAPATFDVAITSRAMAVGPNVRATFAAHGEYKTEQLERRSIEGIDAEGTRTTMTIPAGSVGNALAIEVVNERWYSPELQVVLMTRRYDPRFGETVYKLTNIVRAEPAPDLFRVPADFRIEDVKGLTKY